MCGVRTKAFCPLVSHKLCHDCLEVQGPSSNSGPEDEDSHKANIHHQHVVSGIRVLF